MIILSYALTKDYIIFDLTEMLFMYIVSCSLKKSL